MSRDSAVRVVLGILQYYGMEGDGGRKFVAEEIAAALFDEPGKK